MLDVRNITLTFNPGTTDEKRALDDLSLHAEHGDFISIIGANGAGKSTLFNAIAGSFYVDEGSISLAGKNITFMPEHERSRRIGRLFQDPLRGTAPSMTIEENLALAYLRAAHGNPFSRISKKDKEFFAGQLRQLDMGLEDRMSNPVGLLSGAMVGQYQKTVDINSGTGIVVIGLACLIIGETLLGRRTVRKGVAAVILGSVVYRFLYAVIFYTKIVPVECLKLLTAVIVALAIAAPGIRKWAAFQKRKMAAGTKEGR